MTLKNDAKFEEKLTLGSKNDMRNLVESLKICIFMGYFCRKYVMSELRRFRGVVL